MFDSGDLELPLGDAALALAQIEERAAAILQKRASGPSCWVASTW